uniref:Snake toxin/toxin-like domain-containing protein n=1 Tax=Sinocyclocheilus grahami TaxID=75366 RepID=A0A672SLY9_SINGR
AFYFIFLALVLTNMFKTQNCCFCTVLDQNSYLKRSTLECYNCVPGTPGGSCVATQETCGYKKDTCVSARFTIPPYSYFRRCISMADCMILQSSPNIKAKCCQTDLCNTSV